MKRIPIKTARDISKDQGYDQVLILGIDKENQCTSVATYGKTQEDCDQIAQGGNWMKRKVLGWPENECVAEPRRVRNLKEQLKKIKKTVRKAVKDIRTVDGVDLDSIVEDLENGLKRK